MVTQIFAYYRRMELGCPRKWSTHVENACVRDAKCVSIARAYAEEMVEDIMATGLGPARIQTAALDCGRQSLEEVVAGLGEFGSGRDKLHPELQPIEDSLVLAQDVDAALVALPTCAGTTNPLAYLPPERARIVADLRCLRHAADDVRGPVPRPCHRITADDDVMWL